MPTKKSRSRYWPVVAAIQSLQVVIRATTESPNEAEKEKQKNSEQEGLSMLIAKSKVYQGPT